MIIFSDDGSSDDTVAKIKNYIDRFEGAVSCQVIEGSHRGPGAARNQAIQAASTDWVAFLDSDDLWTPEKLKEVEAAIRSQPDANFFCHDETKIHRDGRRSSLIYGQRYRENYPLPQQLYIANMFSTSAVVCRKEIIMWCNGFDETLMSAQDYDLWLRMSPYLRPFFIRKSLGTYIERPGNITSGSVRSRLKNEILIAWKYHAMVPLLYFFIRICRILASYSRQLVFFKYY